jgi:flagellar biosynthetic protein FliQ
LIVGIAVSLFQAVTQVNEPTLVFIPKLAVSFVILLVAGPWMADQMLQFTTRMFTMLPVLAR